MRPRSHQSLHPHATLFRLRGPDEHGKLPQLPAKRPASPIRVKPTLDGDVAAGIGFALLHAFTRQSVNTARKMGLSSLPLPKRRMDQATCPLSRCSRKLYFVPGAT